MADTGKQQISDVYLQQLLDAGLNGFALQLLVESIATVKDRAAFKKIQFRFRGVEFTFDWSGDVDFRHH